MKNQFLIKEYIFEAFLSLLEKNNYDKISVCEICSKAGVSRMSFYRNFSSKEDLILKGFEAIMNKINKTVYSLELKNEYTILKVMFEQSKPYKNIIASIEKSSISNIITLEITKKFQEISPNDYINKNSKYIPIFYFSAVSAILITWLKDGAKESPDEMARLITSMINNNIFTHKKENINEEL